MCCGGCIGEKLLRKYFIGLQMAVLLRSAAHVRSVHCAAVLANQHIFTVAKIRTYAVAVIIVINSSSLRVQRSNPENLKVMINMDCFVGYAASQ
jgi:hypothetical protein